MKLDHRHNIGVTRREFIQVGYSGLLGLGMASAMGSAQAAIVPKRRAKSVIIVFLTGGASHHEMWDMKPDAPAEIRGEFKPMATNVPGIQVCEHMPKLAQRMDRMAVVRSMCHKNAGHLPATHWVLTGKAMPNLPIDSGADKIRSRTDWPCYSAGVDYFQPRTDGMPSGVNLPTYLQEPPLLWPGQYSGCMGPKHDPWQITHDPNKPDFRVENLSLPKGFAVERMKNRQSLLNAVNQGRGQLEALAETRALSDKQSNAFTLLTSSRFGEAFHMDQEPGAVRDRYGRHMFGQTLLLARRLVEVGVPVVQANMGSVQTWDSHANIPNRFKNDLLPPLDTGVSALLDDVKERGLADETLVIITGEFGRTPKIKDAGRDHWPDVFSTVFSGAGVHGGQVIGASDPTGGFPATHGFTPEDLGATLYSAMGIAPESEFIDVEGRPQRLNTGEVIQQLYTARGV